MTRSTKKALAIGGSAAALAGAGYLAWRSRLLAPPVARPVIPQPSPQPAPPPWWEQAGQDILSRIGSSLQERIEEWLGRLSPGTAPQVKTVYPASAAAAVVFREAYTAAVRAGDDAAADDVQAAWQWWNAGQPVRFGSKAEPFAVAPAVVAAATTLGSIVKAAAGSALFQGIADWLRSTVRACTNPFGPNREWRAKLDDANQKAFANQLEPPRSRPRIGGGQKRTVTATGGQNPGMEALVIPFDQDVTVTYSLKAPAGTCDQEAALVQILANQGGRIVPVFRREVEGVAKLFRPEPRSASKTEKVRLTAGAYVVQAAHTGEGASASITVEYEDVGPGVLGLTRSPVGRIAVLGALAAAGVAGLMLALRRL